MNERIKELRQRIEKDPGTRLFAQLGEELRRAGKLQDAIEVCRKGILKHPRYWSARLTLARSLLESGAAEDAAREYTTVLEEVPDNIVARRSLGECLEKTGDLKGAISQYKEALLYSPGDEWCRRKIEELAAEKKNDTENTGMRTSEKKIAEVAELLEEVGGIEEIQERKPIKIVEAVEEFELERPYDSHDTEESIEKEKAVERQEDPRKEKNEGLLDSPTLAELYLAQGHVNRAVGIYRKLIERSDEESKKYDTRYQELLKISESDVKNAADPRRCNVERTIMRLEALLEAAQRRR